MNHMQRKMYLTSENILKYLLTSDDKLETLIFCQSANCDIAITSQALYESLGAIQEYDDFKLQKLVKLLEVADVASQGKTIILTHEKVEELRKKALSGGNQNVKNNRN